jgi:hypothetical protein
MEHIEFLLWLTEISVTWKLLLTILEQIKEQIKEGVMDRDGSRV